MNSKSLSSGRIITHLSEHLADLKVAFSKSAHELERACKRVSEDPVFQVIDRSRFTLPSSSSRPFLHLTEQVREISSLATAQHACLQPYLNSFENFMRRRQLGWDEHSYFIVPLVSEADGKLQRTLVYLHAVPNENNQRATGDWLDVDQLTNDHKLRVAARNYFGELASILFESLYFVQTYPLDAFNSLAGYSYRSYFGSQITHDRSIGAAALALLSVTYLESVLTGDFQKAVAPRCGTIITGEVDRSGRILPVEYLAERIECAIDEFGGGVKVIVPRAEPLPERIERRIDTDNLRYVSTAEELLAQVLSSQDDLAGLDQARTALFKRLAPSEKARLKKYVIEGARPDVYDMFADGRTHWITPKSHAGGLYTLSTAGRDQLDLTLSLNLAGFKDNSGGELLELILDGSDSMNEHWIPNTTTGICRMTAVLYEIRNRIDPEKQELVCGFLSHQEFDRIGPTVNREELEQRLQEIRLVNELSHRGSFFRPVYESSLGRYQNRLKRVFVISDSAPPDLYDLLDLNLSSMTRFGLFRNDDNTAADSEPELILYPDGKKLDKTELDRYFKKQSGSIQSVRLNFGDELPIEWEPEEGVLSSVEDDFELHFAKVNDLKFTARVRFANQCPPEIKVNTKISKRQTADTFDLAEHPRLYTPAPLDLTLSGKLTGEEFETWRTFETPDWICPQCGNGENHLLHMPEARAEEVPIFPSLNGLSGGYLLLCRNLPDWRFFHNGCRLFGTSFVLLNGRLHWSRLRGRVDEVRNESTFYCVRDTPLTFYLCQIT